MGSQVEQLIVQVDLRADQARNAVGGARDLVNELKQTLQDSAKELVTERVSSLPEIDNVQRRLATAMERADGWVQVSASTAELIEQLLATIGTVPLDSNAGRTGSAELILTIRSARESLADASERLADLQERLAEIRQKRDVDVNLLQITKLSLGIVAKLDVVQEQVAAFRTRLDETKNRLGKLQDTIRVWVSAGQCLIVLLIGWGGAGQYCLLLQGWRILRSPPTTVRESPAAVGRG